MRLSDPTCGRAPDDVSDANQGMWHNAVQLDWSPSQATAACSPDEGLRDKRACWPRIQLPTFLPSTCSFKLLTSDNATYRSEPKIAWASKQAPT
jgi:hypothetical protein